MLSRPKHMTAVKHYAQHFYFIKPNDVTSTRDSSRALIRLHPLVVERETKKVCYDLCFHVPFKQRVCQNEIK